MDKEKDVKAGEMARMCECTVCEIGRLSWDGVAEFRMCME
jgi:hypothetical protein